MKNRNQQHCETEEGIGVNSVPIDDDNRLTPPLAPQDNEVRTMQQEDQDAWQWAVNNHLI